MEREDFFPDWRDLVTFATPHPEPTLLRNESDLRVLVAGLEPGGEIPAHPERLAVYHVLEGQARRPSTTTATRSRRGRR